MSASKNYTRRIHRTGISTHIYHENQPNASKYIIHYISLHVGIEHDDIARVSPQPKDLPCVAMARRVRSRARGRVGKSCLSPMEIHGEFGGYQLERQSRIS